VVWPVEGDVHGGWGRSGDWSVPGGQTRIRREIYTRERRGYLTVTLRGVGMEMVSYKGS